MRIIKKNWPNGNYNYYIRIRKRNIELGYDSYVPKIIALILNDGSVDRWLY